MMTDKFVPVRTAKELATLNGDEIEKGYFAGRDGQALTWSESRSYIHGWRNGVADAGVVQPDEAQIELVRDVKRAKSEGKFDW